MFLAKLFIFGQVFYYCHNLYADLVNSETDKHTDEPPKVYEIEVHPNVHLLPLPCGKIEKKPLIYGGRAAKPHQYPWMALISVNNRKFDEPTSPITTSTPAVNTRLLKKGKQTSGIQLRAGVSHFNADAVGESGDLLIFKCGGSIINSRYILTAAHCVIRDQKNIGVRVGEHDYSQAETCQGEGENKTCTHSYEDVEVEEIITHKSFLKNDSRSHDIALLRLRKPLNFTKENIAPICLPKTKKLLERSLDGMSGTVAGWGQTESAASSNVLMTVWVTIRDKCDRAGLEDVICAGDFKKDSCSGDSGGPLMVLQVYETLPRQFEYGIVSSGPIQCGSKDDYGLYTDVTKHMHWILDNIRP